MPVGSMYYVYQLTDFSTTGGNITPPDEQGARAQGNPPFNITLNTGASNTAMHVDDSNALFEEINGGDQTLSSPITLDGVTYPIGTSVIINYEISTDTGFKLYSFTLGANNTGNNTTTGVVTNGPMVPGQQYVFTSETNIGGGGIPYADLACFTAGTLIRTPGGQRAIETLAPGDLVWTLDHGFQPLRWVGSTDIAGTGDAAPVTLGTGTIGNDQPLLLSPNHRVLLSGPDVELMFGTAEVLAPAKSLVDGSGVRITPRQGVRYFHLQFDRHEIVESNGALTESLLSVEDEPIKLRGCDVLGAVPECLHGATPARQVIRCRDAALFRGARRPVTPISPAASFAA